MLYKYLSDRTAAWLAPHLGYESGSEEFATLQYGCNVFYLNLLKTILLIVIALFLGIFRYVLIFAVAFSALRLYSFGVHLAHPITCTLLGLLYYLGSVYLSLHVTIPPWVSLLVLCGCFFLFIRYAPAPSKNRPVSNHQRGSFKIRSLIILAVVAVVGLTIHQAPVYSNLLVLAAVCQTVNLLPVTYKLLRKEVTAYEEVLG